MISWAQLFNLAFALLKHYSLEMTSSRVAYTTYILHDVHESSCSCFTCWLWAHLLLVYAISINQCIVFILLKPWFSIHPAHLSEGNKTNSAFVCSQINAVYVWLSAFLIQLLLFHITSSFYAAGCFSAEWRAWQKWPIEGYSPQPFLYGSSSPATMRTVHRAGLTRLWAAQSSGVLEQQDACRCATSVAQGSSQTPVPEGRGLRRFLRFHVKEQPILALDTRCADSS